MLPVIMASSTLSDPQSTFEFSKGVHPALADHQSHYPHHQIQRPLYMFASPEDYRDNGHYREDHDMEHCSEQDDVREREHDDDEEDEDEDEDEALHARKIARHHRAADTKDRSVPNCAVQPARAGADEEDDLEENNSFASTCSSRKPSLTSSPLREESKAFRKIAKPKGGSQKRQASLQAVLDDAIAELEEDNHGQDGSGTQSLKGQGLGYYAPLVCDRVERRGVTTYNDLVHDLAGNQHTERAEGAASQEQGNIRRRVYDALNILEALGIIAMDKKEIRWIGIHDSKPIRDVSRKVQLTNPTYQNAYPSPRLQHRERDGADESEEPEDDEMEIEQLQKEVEAMKLRNALELARLQDQVARHVQVNNLIERNKAREEKELERQMRRRQKKQERKEEKRALAVAATGSDSMEVDDEPAELDGSIKKAERRHHRHSRHRSPRLEDKKNDNDEDGDEESGDARQGKGTAGEEVDEETARRIRKQERRERRERKERRAQRRQEKEAAAASHDKEQRIQLPFVGVRIPLYAGQSSDSEASISVVRRVREEPRSRKSGKSKKHDAIGDETTMVEIKIPHQEELSIISDTEILGEMGLNQVPLTDLKAMLPQEAFDKARYTTATVQDIVDSGNENMCVVATVRGGFERALVCSGVAH
ncbi:Transcription factor Dp-2 [Mortierella claussenii]|nr:Transcription factor Dp-2 [Mortierella claussenii]